MQSFLERHRDRIIGVLSGYDRVLFRGTLRSISYVKGLEMFLYSRHILLKDFGGFAAQCTDTLVRYAESVASNAERPFIYLNSSGESKEKIARAVAERDEISEGLICVLYAVEPCKGFDVYRNRKTRQIELVSRSRKCRFYYFYYMDRQLGFMHVRLQSWFPFEMQVCINGREALSRYLDRTGIGYERRGNAFVRIDDMEKAQEVMDRLGKRKWTELLRRFAERVNPLRSGLLEGVFDYYWTIRQSEVATDVMFRDRRSLAQLYERLCDHAIRHFGVRDVLRFFSKAPCGAAGREASVEYRVFAEGVRIKHWLGGNSIKMYDKESTILRVETTINDPRQFRVMRSAGDGRSAPTPLLMRKGVMDAQRRVEVSLAANARYLEALAVVGEETPSCRLFDSVSERVIKERCAHRALRPISPDESRIFAAILHGEHLIGGFTNADLRARLFEALPAHHLHSRPRSGWVTRRLRLLRAHRLIRKVPGRRLYRVTPRGHAIMTTALRFRHSNIALLNLAAA